MKITALGVGGAFATGTYEQAVPVEQALELILRLRSSERLEEAPEDEIRERIDEISKRVYIPKWHSNFLIEFDMIGKRGKPPYRLLLDAGGDLRHSLKNIGLAAADIDGIYISHPHNDHIGGMEYIGLTTLFNPFYTKAKKDWLGDQFIAHKLFLEHEDWPFPPPSAKPDLFVHRKVLGPLRRSIGPGLDTVQGVPEVDIDTYFNLNLIGKQENGETKTYTFRDGDGEWRIKPIFAMHVISSSEEMASYGISLEHNSGYNVLMPTDTQHMMPPQLESHYQRAQRIYMDCETSEFPSGVHPHISDLKNRMSPDIQKKCLLYHYDEYPNAPEGMFYGVLRPGDVHTYPE